MRKNYFRLLKNYFSGKQSIDSENLFMQWLQLPGESVDEIESEVKEEVRKRIELKLRKTISETSEKENLIRLSPVQWQWYAAASLLILSVIGYGSWTPALLIDEPIAQVKRINTTTTGSCITLPDGSTVELKGNSKIWFPEYFSNNRREVFLEGEAFFKVVRDTSRIFIVSSGKVRTMVLGTSFNIKAYPGQSVVEVLVSTGKVAVEDTVAKSLVTLLPNQRAVYEDKAGVLRKDTIPPSNEHFLSENEGEIIFNDLPLDMAIRVLHQRFGVNIILDNDNLKNCKVSVTFKDKTVVDIMDDICLQTGAKYSIETNQYHFTGKGCLSDQ